MAEAICRLRNEKSTKFQPSFAHVLLNAVDMKENGHEVKIAMEGPATHFIPKIASALVAGDFLSASTTFARGASVIKKAERIDPSQFDYYTAQKGKYGPGFTPKCPLNTLPHL